MVRLKDLMRTHPRDAVFLHDMPSAESGFNIPLLETNPAATELLRYSPDELLGMSFRDIIGSHTMGREFIAALLEDGHAACETMFTARDGSPVAVTVDIHVLETENGPRCLTVARDRSKIRKLEVSLDEARSEVKRALEAKHEFLANISHELRTPLNGFLGMTQILMGTDLTPSQREYLTLSQDAARRLTKVMSDLISLSCVESGDIELVKTTFELHTLMNGLIAPLSRQAAEKSIALTLDIDPEVPDRIRGDSSKLRQILINLLFNSIRFTEQGEVAISVTLAEDAGLSDTCMIAFTVRDTGIGIPEEKQNSIFDNFFLGEDYLTKEYGGAGLGLSISRQLAEVMEGVITVKSTPGEGSEFTLVVPFQVAAPLKEEDAISRPLMILLAEDEQVNSIMASRLLKKEGHAVTIVGNGQQAIEALCSSNYDLVLMDVQMPVVNGVQATRIIRNGSVENVPRDLPIIGITAFARTSEKKQFIEAGMDRIITKPYEADELIRAVATTVRRH